MKLAQITATQTAGNNLGICMTLFYAYFPLDATAFPVGENNFCHAPGRGWLNTDRTKIPRTSLRGILTPRCRSSTLAARNRSIVFRPIKIGHAQASCTRMHPRGSELV
jgi:hypothetical protein